MFAYRLAKEMGRPDVGGLMRELSPEKFDEWWAASLTGYMDDGWSQAAMVCAVMVNLMREVAAAFAGMELTEADLEKPSTFMPTLEKKEEPKVKIEDPSVSNFGKMLAARFKATQ